MNCAGIAFSNRALLRLVCPIMHVKGHTAEVLPILSAGSVTRHLQLLTGSAVEVDCLAMEPVSPDDDGLPPAVTALPHPLLQREVPPDVQGNRLQVATWLMLRPYRCSAAAVHLLIPTSTCCTLPETVE